MDCETVIGLAAHAHMLYAAQQNPTVTDCHRSVADA